VSALADPTLDTLADWLAAEPAVLVSVRTTQGSVPREEGTWMAVFAKRVLGTVGGGHLEHEAIATARTALGGADLPAERRFALGPSLGQCCGGVMHLGFEHVHPESAKALCERLAAEADARRMPVALFGGGHVGRAIVRALAPLPVRVMWIDSRDQIFPEGLPAHVSVEHSAPVEAAVRGLAPCTRVLIMSFSHAEDLEVVAACLKREKDLPFIGLIGSKSKWASFRHRLQARGFAPELIARVSCPIGVAGVVGKEPEVIAAAVAAQLMQQRPALPLDRPAPLVLRAPQPGDMGWVVQREAALYAHEFGYDATFEALVAEIVARFVQRFDAQRERCWIAEIGGLPVGAVFVVRKSPRTAQLRLLHVESAARGQGVGARLVDECIAFARAAGYRKMMLWTQSHLDAARRIYQSRGFVLASDEPHHSFGKDLVAQVWTLDL
jgi:xanthine dehydrogenase accessory factor